MDILFVNGVVVSLDKQNRIYDAIGIKKNKIVFLGNNDQISQQTNNFKEIIDLKGAFVIPGFIDSHLHLLNTGYTMSKLNLNRSQSIEEIIDAGKQFIERNQISSDDWLLCRGWNQDKMNERRMPTKNDLDKISKEIPIIATRACGHIAVCNTVVLNQINWNSLKNDDNIDFETGLFKEDSLNDLYRLIPSPNVASIKKMLCDAANHMVKNGITSVQSDDLRCMPDQDVAKVVQAFNELNESGELPIRVYQQCLMFNKNQLNTFIKQGHQMGQGDDFFKIGPIKLLLDGGIGGRTALLEMPYNDDPQNCGVASFTQDELNEIVQIADENGFQIAAHAIGDKAMQMFIDALKNSPYYKASNPLRHGIVHAQITTPKLIDEMIKSHLVTYVQPIFLDYDMHIIHDRIGNRANDAYAFGTMYQSGIVTGFSTDSPVEDVNPFENIYCATTRLDVKGYAKAPYLVEECFSISDALKAYTTHSAYCSFEEDKKGTLEIGKLADFIAINKDLYQSTKSTLKDAAIIFSIVDGKIKYGNY